MLKTLFPSLHPGATQHGVSAGEKHRDSPSTVTHATVRLPAYGDHSWWLQPN